jgi:DNA-binding transcriptional MerR regulator
VTPADVQIPDKAYFKIGEVAKLAGVKPYVLRYWETEFRGIRPKKSRSQQRLYDRRDVELVLTIRRLLYAEGYTIAGAKKRLVELKALPPTGESGPAEKSSPATTETLDERPVSEQSAQPMNAPSGPSSPWLKELHAELTELCQMLDEA